MWASLEESMFTVSEPDPFSKVSSEECKGSSPVDVHSATLWQSRAEMDLEEDNG